MSAKQDAARTRRLEKLIAASADEMRIDNLAPTPRAK
jgi:hypothetical protein